MIRHNSGTPLYAAVVCAVMLCLYGSGAGYAYGTIDGWASVGLVGYRVVEPWEDAPWLSEGEGNVLGSSGFCS